MHKTKCILPLVVLSLVFLCADTASDSGIRSSEESEEARVLKLANTMRAKFQVPAEEARRKGDFDTAITLLQREANAWKSKDWHSSWAKQTRKAKLIDAWSSIAAMYEEQQRFDKAAQFYMQCENLFPKGHYLYLAANAFCKGKEFGKAEELYENQIKTGAVSEYDAHILLAQVLEDEGNLTGAEKLLKDFLSISNIKHDYYQVRAARTALVELFKKENRLAEMEKLKIQMDDKTCPICGSNSQVLQFAYGLRRGPEPIPVHYGGCVVTAYSPRWWCDRDHAAF